MKKLKRITLCLITSFAFVNANAQLEGSSSVHAGYGIGNFVQSIFSLYEDTYDEYSFSSTGPFFLKYEYGVNDKVTLGLNIAYVAAEMSYKDNNYLVGGVIPYEETVDWNSMSFLARVNFHFGSSDRLDPFWGFGFGYRTANWTYDNNDPTYEAADDLSTVFPLGFEATIGARYYFIDNLGIYAETGIAKAVFQFGASARF